MNKSIKIILMLFFTASIGFIFISYFFANAFLSPNRVSIGAPPAKFNFEIVSFRTSDNLLIKGWYSRYSDTSATIILLHGYKANRLEMISRCEIFRNGGYNLLLYDARGCGESEGDLVSFGYYEIRDLLAALRFLKVNGDSEIAIYGFSQGGATILMAADSLKDIKCIIAEGTFDKLENAIDNRFESTLYIPGKFGAWLMIPFAESKLGININKIEPVNEVSKINFPILIIGGENDDRTLKENTIMLYETAKEPKELWIVKNSGHTDIFSNNPEIYRSEVLDFLNKYFR